MKTKQTPDEMMSNVKILLKSLGADYKKVTETLAKLKIKGRVKSAGTCPISKLIKKNYKELKEVVSDYDEISFSYCKTDCIIRTPKVVSVFMEKFDNGAFPQLKG